MGWLRDRFKAWLQITPAMGESIAILEPMTFEASVLRNRIWYRGEPAELQQFYQQNDDMTGNTSFWASYATGGIHYRKIHSGLPAMMVDTLSDLVCNDLIGISLDEEERQAVWDKIASDSGFGSLLKQAVRIALSMGDGAFKISVDKTVSPWPILEFYQADRIRMEHKRGRLYSITFLTAYERERKEYTLEERYGRGSITYRLMDEKGQESPLETLDETAGLQDVYFADGVMMAVPLLFDESPKWAGRGRSIYDGKTGAFDSLDETISQWVDALRDGRVVKYIPSNLLPRNPETGVVLKPNSFDSRYVQTDADMTENSQDNKIKVAQPDIRTDALTASYINFLDICLQGIMAPSTLGIDVKKLDNAEAQREKEKATLYTRNRIIHVLQQAIPEVVRAAMDTYALMTGGEPVDMQVKAEFGEYANPSFEAQIETIGKGRQYGIMSLETAMEQLYGDTWTKEDKSAEVMRLKAEMGQISAE